MLNSAPIVMDRPEVPHPEPAALAGGLEQASAVSLREQNGVVGVRMERYFLLLRHQATAQCFKRGG